MVACVLTAPAGAAPIALWPQDSIGFDQAESLKPAAVIFFSGDDERLRTHADMAHRAVQQARTDLGLEVREYTLERHELAARMDKIAESNVGLVVIVDPPDLDALMKIPGLYPDLRFSIIGLNAPLYLANVSSLVFSDAEGVFLMGALAALRAQNGAVSFVDGDDTPAARTLAYAYFQGAKYADPTVQVLQQIGGASRGDHADVALVMNEELLDSAARHARRQHHSIIAFDQDATSLYPGVALTGLVKHYDLALYAALKEYRQKEWKPGPHPLGVDGGYVDYVLGKYNRQLLPKDTIEQVEMTKDLIAQGLVKIAPLE